MANFLKTNKTISVLIVLGFILLFLLFFNYKLNPAHFLADLEGSLVNIINPSTDTTTPTPLAPVLTTINITPLTASLTVGGVVQQLTAAALDQNGAVISATLTWASDNTAVATVDDTGLVTPVAAGTANITASSDSVISSAPSVITVIAQTAPETPTPTITPPAETTPPVEETITPTTIPPTPQPKVEVNILPVQNPPVITKVISPILSGNFKSGVIPIMVLFNKAVSVSGTPQLVLSTGNPATTVVNYKSGFKKSLLFLYHIAPGNYSSDIDYSSSSSLILNGGQIQDSSGNSANLTLPEPGSVGSLSNHSNIIIDAKQ